MNGFSQESRCLTKELCREAHPHHCRLSPLQSAAQSRDHFQAGAGNMIRSFPRPRFLVVDFSVMKDGRIDLAVLMVHKAFHEEAGLQIEGLPILLISRELVSVEQSNQSLALLPPLHVSVFCRLSRTTVAVDASV